MDACRGALRELSTSWSEYYEIKRHVFVVEVCGGLGLQLVLHGASNVVALRFEVDELFGILVLVWIIALHFCW